MRVLITIHDLNLLTHPEHTRAEGILVPSHRLAICPPGAPDWTPRVAAPKDGDVLFFGTLEPRKNVGGLLDADERPPRKDVVRRVWDTYQEAIERRGRRARSA